ncbi:alkaline phosphatase D family protein [Marinicella sp. W31]|uniref:alkaline phosphatase D family protein n=1 Tax=Marinicella sp. W31 TaxID=3023713 RepID=UPI003756B3A4
MNKKLILLLAFCVFSVQAEQLKSGPMLGHTALRAANIWVQANEKGTATLEYWASDNENVRKKLTAELDSTYGNVHTFLLQDLEPATRYNYQLSVNGKPVNRDKSYSFVTQTLWQWRTDPPEFSVLTGSCNFENEAEYDRAGKPYGGGWEIFDRMTEEKADMMLWLGDNWYYREVDFDAEQSLLYRVELDRGRDHLQKILARYPNYAIWDDHDYGPDNADSSFIFKQKALDIFKKYWANPSYGMPETDGIFTKVRFNDVDFFLLDDRYHRSHELMPDGPEKIMYGQEQLTWLKNQLLRSEASFKFIVGGNQMLNDYNKFEGWDKYRHERNPFVDWLHEAKIKGVVFLSGDKHHTELLKIDRKDAYPLYEITCSPFTAGTHERWLDDDRAKSNLVKGTLVGTKNYCKLNFSGPRKDRSLTIEVYGPEGEQHWKRSIKSSVLSYSQVN